MHIPNTANFGTMGQGIHLELAKAACHDRHFQIRELISQGANPLAQNAAGYTALMFAADRGALRAVEALIECSDLDARDICGSTALMEAAAAAASFMDGKAIVEMLAAKGGVSLRDNLGRTPLIIAAIEESPDACEALLAAGGDPKASDNEGNTALMHAAHRSDEATFNILLPSSDTSARNARGQSALDLSRKAHGPTGFGLARAAPNARIIHVLEGIERSRAERDILGAAISTPSRCAHSNPKHL